jgi:hypothetical protein
MSRRRLAGALAALLTAAVVAGLVYLRFDTGRLPMKRAAPSGQVAGPTSSGHLIGSLETSGSQGISCTLPVEAFGYAEARVSLPSGAVYLDQVVERSAGGGSPLGGTYLRGRWLPVPEASVSPDGASYAYATQTSGAPGAPIHTSLYLHDIGGGSERLLWSTPGHGEVAGWGPGGVYVTLQPPAPSGKGWIDVVDFWVVSPSQPSAAHRVGPNPALPAPTNEATIPLFSGLPRLGAGAAWAVDYGQPIGPIPPGGVGITRTQARLMRMDLRDGTLSTWYTAPAGTSLGMNGLDAQGHPVLTEYMILPRPASLPPGSFPLTPPPEVLVIDGPNHVVTIADGSDTTFRPGSAVADGHGIWVTSPGSIWLYSKGSLVRVAGVPAGVFPTPTPPPSRPGQPTMPVFPTPPPGYPTGPQLVISGPCT